MTHTMVDKPASKWAGFMTTLAGTATLLGKRAIAPHRASIANLVNIPLTTAGIGFIDFAAFHLAHGWGWLVTGLSLMVLEHIIADEGGSQ